MNQHPYTVVESIAAMVCVYQTVVALTSDSRSHSMSHGGDTPVQGVASPVSTCRHFSDCPSQRLGTERSAVGKAHGGGELSVRSTESASVVVCLLKYCSRFFPVAISVTVALSEVLLVDEQ